MTRGENFCELLQALYELREKTFDVQEMIEQADIVGGAHIALHEFKKKAEAFDGVLSEQIVEILTRMLELER